MSKGPPTWPCRSRWCGSAGIRPIDQQFFDFCLTRLRRSTCFPMMWNDKVVPGRAGGLGVAAKTP